MLARYTDENTPEKIRGRLRDGNQGAPAILYIPYGKGCILYCGPSLPVQDISPERPAEHFICRALEVLSKGELYGRFYTGKMDQTELLTISAPDEEIRQYPAPNEKPQPVPRDYEIIEETAQLQDFCLTGRWPQGEPASILVGYWSSQNTTEIAANAGKLFVKQIRGGQIQTLGVAPEPPPNSFVLIMRRGGLLTIAAEDKILFRSCMGLLQQGALAVKGLQNPEYQPLAPIHFTDDFMREEGYSGEWEIVSGSWKVVTTEGKPETGVNPFNYQANSNNEAISLTGDWFWSDLAFSASVQNNKSQAVGLIANYKSPQNFVLLKLQFNEAPQIARLQLWQKQGAKEYILAEAPVSASRADWHRLQIRSSNGRLQGWLNGQPVLEARGFPLACGRVGLYCQQGAASFDDVLVEPWMASPPEGLPRREEMYLANGEWKYDVASDTLSGVGAGGARALLPWTGVKNCLAAVRVKLGQAEAAGLLLQADAQTGTWIMLLRAEKGLRLKAFRQGKPPQTLLETALGGSAAEWHSLYARYNGARLQIVVNGRPLAPVLDGAAGAGTVGLYARGKQPAFFRDFQAWAEPAEEYLADEMTPQFAGVMDRNSWAGRCGSWTPDPQQLNCLWHAGFFPGPVRLEAGIHPLGAKETTTQLHLSRMGEPQNGYTLQAQRKWASPVVDLTLAFQGRIVAQGRASVAPQKPYVLSLERCGADILASVNRRSVLCWRDSQPRPELPGGCMKVEYTIKAAPRSFSLWLTAGSNPMDLSAYDRFVLYLRGNVPSMTLVVKDATASDTDPDNPQGVAEYIIRGITAQWRNFEAPFAQFRPRQAGGKINWRAIKHIGLAMIAPQNAESGTFWADNLRACAGPYRPQR